MATPQRLINESGPAQEAHDHVPMIFQKSAEWEGVKVVHYRLEPGQVPSRTHKTHEVFVPLVGSVTIEGSGEDGAPARRRRKVGDISVTPAGIRYSAHWEEELESLTVSLTEDFLKRTTIDFEAHRNARIVLSCGPQDALVRSIALALADEVDNQQPAGRLYAESLVNALAVHLLRHYSTDSLIPDLQFGGLPAHKLRRVSEFVQENLERDLSLAEIAQAAELSPFHFARSFKQTTGLTPIQFLTQRRVEQAKQLLVHDRLPLVEIGLRVGFKNQSHFTTLFRRMTTMTPKAYRDAAQR
ncbi:MAG: helix-turn-helix domain-containing protein [Blastocatellia bacterium]